jgi:hypothetical protein
METTSIPLQKVERRTRGRSTVVLGTGLALLGLAIYIFQLLVLKILVVPWYLPVATTAGVILCLVGLVQRRSIWRWLGPVVTGLLAAAAWSMVLGLNTPPYTGALAEGRPFPEFVAARADGNPFTRQDLMDKNTVLVFFRGHW